MFISINFYKAIALRTNLKDSIDIRCCLLDNHIALLSNYSFHNWLFWTKTFVFIKAAAIMNAGSAHTDLARAITAYILWVGVIKAIHQPQRIFKDGVSAEIAIIKFFSVITAAIDMWHNGDFLQYTRIIFPVEKDASIT
jgi:hypothetical protein